MLLVCRVCGEEKSGDSFSVRRDSGKPRSACKPCRSSEAAASRYGLSIGEVLALAEKQGHCCAICGTHKDDIPHEAFKHNPLVIDHDHETGRVRGLLCPSCNLVLGHAKDDVKVLAQAISYLT